MASQDSTRWWIAAELAVGLCVVACPLALGGAHENAFFLLAGTSAVAVTTWVIGAWKHRRRVTWHPLLALPLGLAVVALLSLLPLPGALHALLTPAGAELRDFSLLPLGLDRARPLTMDAPSTWRALARIVSLGSLGFVVLQLGRLEGPRRRMMMVVSLTGGLVAVVGFGHLLAGAESLFGWHHFYGNVPLLSFFGNTNHLAGYLAFTATVALGLALSAPTREHAIGWGAVAMVIGLAVFLSFSRGGVGLFVASWFVIGALLLSKRQGGVRNVLPWLVIAAVTVFALSLASEPLLERLSSVSSLDRLKQTKLELWPMFFTGANAYARAGMGLGAFELAFSPYQTTELEVTFTHPENVVLQWLSELGVPLAALLFAGAAFVLVRLVRRTRGALLEQLLLVAVVFAFAHDLFDFALELNALPPAVMVVAALIASSAPASSSKDPGPTRGVVRRTALVAVAFVIVVLSVSLWRGLPGHRSAEESLVALTKQGVDLETLRREALWRIDRHPSDWSLYAIVASQLPADRAPRETLAWVNRALFLRPRDAQAHVAAARALLVLKQPTQALLELKTAWSLGDESTLDQGVQIASALGAWDRLLVDTPGLLTRLWNRTRALNRPADGQALIDAAQLLPPSRDVALEADVLEVWQSSLAGNGEVVLARLEALPQASRDQPELVVLRARTLAAVARAAEGISSLDAFARRSPGNVDLAMALAELLAKEDRLAEARAAIDRVRPFVTAPRARASLFQTEATLWMKEERWGRALDCVQTASRIEPGRADLHYQLADIYERMGSLHSAVDEVRKGRVLDTPDRAKAQDPWLERLEAAMSRPVAPP